MNGAIFLEISISLIFIYLLLCIIVSGIVEVFNKWTRKRGRMLRQAIEKVLNDPQNKNWADMFYNHPLIGGLKRDYKALPHYISSCLFSSVIIDLISKESKDIKVSQDDKGIIRYEEVANGDALQQFTEGTNKLNESDFKTILRTFLDDSATIESLKVNMAKWYDDYMDRLTGWFKWDMKKLSLWVAIGLTVLFNIDTLKIMEEIIKNDKTRMALLKDAEQSLTGMSEMINHFQNSGNEDVIADTSSESVAPLDSVDTLANNYLQVLDTLIYGYQLPIGWPQKKTYCNDLPLIKCYWSYLKLVNFRTIVGWIITILALTFGAPFWFEILNILVNARNSGIVPAKVKKENT